MGDDISTEKDHHHCLKRFYLTMVSVRSKVKLCRIDMHQFQLHFITTMCSILKMKRV